MKHIRLSIMAAAMLFSCTIGAKAQSADEIIQKHIAAIGGFDNWKKVSSMKMTGSVNAQGKEIDVAITKLNGKGERFEMAFGGMTNYQVLNTKEGWAYFPAFGQQKPEAMTAEDVKEAQDDLDVTSGLFDYKAKGNQVAFLGKDDMEGTECYKLKLTHKNGKEETVFIDASNYYHIRSTMKLKANGKEMEQKVNYGNFKKLPEGIVMPMSIDQGMGAMAIKNVEINKPIDESIFKPTAADISKGAGK
jgi:hypothetical protein